MKVSRSLETFKEKINGSVVTIGNFDGFHIGHRTLIQKTVSEARSLGVPSIVVTFSPHPVEVLKPAEPFFRLFCEEDQEEVLTEMGVDFLIVQDFNLEFSEISASEFLKHYIFDQLQADLLVLGYDFHFGKGRTGDLHFLEDACAQNDVGLLIIPPQQRGTEKISSSWVRELIKKGDMELVTSLLDRPFYLQGEVVVGQQRGEKGLVRTANILPRTQTMLKRGVYITQVSWGKKKYPSVTNVGCNPTFGGQELSIETHLLGEEMNLYGEKIKVEFLRWLRDEKKFSTQELLREQIQEDIQTARSYFEKKN